VSSKTGQRPQFSLQAFTFLNDVEHPLKEDNLAAIRAYEIQPLFWSQREQASALLNGAA
jgi:hypothetical protein